MVCGTVECKVGELKLLVLKVGRVNVRRVNCTASVECKAGEVYLIVYMLPCYELYIGVCLVSVSIHHNMYVV